MTLKKKHFVNSAGKGENTSNQPFLLFPPLFPFIPKQFFFFYITFILSSANAFNLDWSQILPFLKLEIQPFTTQFQLVMTLKKKPFQTIEGKGENACNRENAGNQHFLFFPQYFLPISKRNFVFLVYFVVCKIWTSLKVCHLVKS